jgi:hypothetical protein
MPTRLNALRLEVEQHPEVEQYHEADENLEYQEKLSLLDQIRLAGLVNQLRYLEHGAVHRQALQLPVDHEAEQHPQDAHAHSPQEERRSLDSHEDCAGQIGYDETRFSARPVLRYLLGLHGARM